MTQLASQRRIAKSTKQAIRQNRTIMSMLSKVTMNWAVNQQPISIREALKN